MQRALKATHPADTDVELRVMTIADKKVKVLGVKLLGGRGTINGPSWSPAQQESGVRELLDDSGRGSLAAIDFFLAPIGFEELNNSTLLHRPPPQPTGRHTEQKSAHMRYVSHATGLHVLRHLAGH